MSESKKPRLIADPNLRRFVQAVLVEYRRSGPAYSNENFKHVLRMSRAIRSDREGLERVGADPDTLIAGILLSDLGKEPHVLERHLSDYGGDRFKAFLDHSRISMREGERLRKKSGVSSRVWREILGAVIGHDGPSIEGSWWKENYEREIGKPYARLHTKNALIHCYLDRIDQGGLFRSSGGRLDGGLRKISYDILRRSPSMNLAAIVTEIFGPTREGTREQLEYLDEVEKPRLLGTTPLPPMIREMKRIFVESERFFERVLLDESHSDPVRIVMDDGSLVAAPDLDAFWKALGRVSPRGSIRN